MTNTSVWRVGLLAILAVVSASCSDTKPPTPVTPTPPTAPTPPPVPVPRDPFPGAGIYEFVSSPSGRGVQSYTSNSRYVLHDDGTFVLQLNLELRGRYKEAEKGRITFDFDWNAQNEGATGVFDGNRMIVTYNLTMSMSDFEDGVYVLKPPAATD
jgi:hypothetical protein